MQRPAGHPAPCEGRIWLSTTDTYLQLDKAGGENRNKKFFGFCAALVAHGVFDVIKIAFLPNGHTHEDIDQLFSRIAERLRHVNVATPIALMELIKKSFTPAPTVVFLNELVDYCSWLVPSMIPSWKGIMSYRYFKIFRGEDHSRVGASDVRIQHRFRMAGPKEANFRSPLPGGARSLSMTWAPPAGQPIFLGPPPSITYSPLTVIPKPLPYAGVRKTVSTLLRLGRIGELECQQWEDYLTPFEEFLKLY